MKRRKTNNLPSSVSIPEGWQLKKLADLGSFIKGKGISRDQLSPTGFPCIRYGEIYTTHDYIIKEFHSFISEEIAEESQLIYSNDILFAGSGETLEDIGKAVAYVGNTKAYAGGDIVILRTDKKHDAKYLAYALNTNTANRQKRKLGQGHSVVHIYSSDLSQLILPLPPIAEQQKIAHILNIWDKAIEKTEQLIAKKQQLKKGLMQKLLTGKVRFKEFVKSKRMKKTKVGMIPDDWAVEELIHLCANDKRSIVDGPFGSNLKTIHFKTEGIPVINSSFVTGLRFKPNEYVFVDEELFRREYRSKVEPGDIVMAKIGARCGASAIMHDNHPISILSGNSLKITIDKTKNDTTYVWYLLKREYLKNQFKDCISVGAQPSISIPHLKKLKLLVTSLKEQRKIGAALKKHDSQIEKLDEYVNALKRQKSGLMQKLLTGDVRVQV